MGETAFYREIERAGAGKGGAVLTGLALCCAILGCASSGERRQPLPPVVADLHTGLTTRGEVLDHLGAPSIVARSSDGRESWAYERDRLTAGGIAPVPQTVDGQASGPIAAALGDLWAQNRERPSTVVGLVIHFDGSGRVAGYALTRPRF